MQEPMPLPEALRMSLEALFKDVQDIAHEAVRDAHPGRLGPTHTTRYDTEPDRTAALNRIRETLCALALTTDITTDELASFRASVEWAVSGLYEHHTTGLRASLGIATEWSAAAAVVGVQRLSGYLATLVVHPGAAPLLDLLDDVEDAFTSGASAVRLTKVMNAVQVAYIAASPGEHFAAFIAYTTHYAALMARPDGFELYATEFAAVVNGLTAARASLAARYAGIRGRSAVRAEPGDDGAPLAAAEHTGPVGLVLTPENSDAERNMRGYRNAYTRYKLLASPSYGEFPDIASARAAAVDVLTAKGAPAEDIAAVRVLGFGEATVSLGLHILIREPVK
jgi:hypothetical protein